MAFLDKEEIEQFYQTYFKRVKEVKTKLGTPLTFAEKIIYAHLFDLNSVTGLETIGSEKIGSEKIGLEKLERGKSNLFLNVDRVAMQDATAQMAILQFMNTGRTKVLVPSTIHCDHLIQAYRGAEKDLQQANLENNEVYQFLKSSADCFAIGFWEPGSGIIHQVVLENYAVPGQLMLGTDSHTPNAGGSGMLAIGVGGAEAVDVMAGEPWKVLMPKIVGIHLKGKLNGWTTAKDIILKVAEILTVKGGTGKILEYFGEGARSLSATGRATITNMGAEVGATSSLFSYDQKTEEYLRATQREFVSDAAEKVKEELQADLEVEKNPLAYYDEFIEIYLDELEPQVVGPHTPDLGRGISQLGKDVQENNWPVELSSALIGSCTNSSYQDLSRAVSIALQAVQRGIKVKVPFYISPGSEQIYQTIKQEGLLTIFEQAGGKVLANACGPCIGQWKRDDVKSGERNSIITSYNRNFKKRQDANSETHAFIASPEIVTVLALAGRLDFNPLVDELEGLRFTVPEGEELPQQFSFPLEGYVAPTGKSQVLINPQSDRLAHLQPFTAWKLGDFNDMLVLLKVKGKCTTDHISPAGKWLNYRGHLDKISNNMYSGAVNAFDEHLIGKGKNSFSGEVQEFQQIARDYQRKKKGWIVVGDENYGEGSSREHAAMEPRYLGCRMVVAKSFARIAETNLKQQGLLPLWFTNKDDYDLILEDDIITIEDVDLDVGKLIVLQVHHQDGSIDAILCKHTFSPEQINWFKAGSALEWLKVKGK
ncbi:aconitate hydratase [Candidatus Woesearchaeota archaeon]|nr:aconitate hydratase [Candidatus Woesearchaeota archaeon]